jgi:bacterioferritin (cytochrome b1)
MAEVLKFPITEPQQRARLAKSEAKDWQLRKLAEAADCASAASSQLSNAVIRMLDGANMGDDEMVVNGDTLEDILQAALFVMDARASNADREMARAANKWLAERAAADCKGGEPE